MTGPGTDTPIFDELLAELAGANPSESCVEDEPVATTSPVEDSLVDGS